MLKVMDTIGRFFSGQEYIWKSETGDRRVTFECVNDFSQYTFRDAETGQRIALNTANDIYLLPETETAKDAECADGDTCEGCEAMSEAFPVNTSKPDHPALAGMTETELDYSHVSECWRNTAFFQTLHNLDQTLLFQIITGSRSLEDDVFTSQKMLAIYGKFQAYTSETEKLYNALASDNAETETATQTLEKIGQFVGSLRQNRETSEALNLAMLHSGITGQALLDGVADAVETYGDFLADNSESDDAELIRNSVSYLSGEIRDKAKALEELETEAMAKPETETAKIEALADAIGELQDGDTVTGEAFDILNTAREAMLALAEHGKK